uniref:Uncharacterized protein n=1 Tax=viral metagenome TaxID=1070528 RepID=A0A6M3XJR8_9ZZZZ
MTICGSLLGWKIFNERKEMKQFFQDDNGQLSMVRLQSLILVVAGIVYAFVTKDAMITGLLIGIGVTGKVVQKSLGEK